jgi:predicted O-methyltransferase YrrM
VLLLRYEDVRDYVEQLIDGSGDNVLSLAHKKSKELRPYGVVSIDPPRGRFLELIMRIASPKKVLEIGPGAGYSALWLLRGMSQSSTLDVVEVNSYVANEFRSIMAKAGSLERVRIHEGPALKVLPRLHEYFNCVFIDANKEEYPAYLQHAMRLTRRGSIIVADNLLWHGSALKRDRSVSAAGILDYTRLIFSDKRLCSLLIPLGDGLGVSFRVK